MAQIGVAMKEQLISVVEDDAFFRDSMRRLMKSLGFSVATFASAAEFLDSGSLSETSCLIADVNMPAMSGLELCRRLNESGSPIPTILVTAYPNDPDYKQALRDGVLAYLRKPIDEVALLQCLGAALARRKADSKDSS
jgi:FixJ family two-component response regulator